MNVWKKGYEGMAGLSSDGNECAAPPVADAQENAAPQRARAIQGTGSDCRRRLRRQMQVTRLREGQPLKGAEINRAQNSFARLREERGRVVHDTVREHRDCALVRLAVARVRHMRRAAGRAMRRVVRANVRGVGLRFLVQPCVQLRADARHAQQHHHRRGQHCHRPPEAVRQSSAGETRMHG